MSVEKGTKTDIENPTEEVGPKGADAEPYECEVNPQDLSAPFEEAEGSFRSELDEAFAPEPIAMVIDPRDGMPTPIDNGQLMLAAPFRIDTVICVEDDRQYAEMFLEEVDEKYGVAIPGNVCVRSRFDNNGITRVREIFSPDKVETRWGMNVVKKEMGLPNGPFPPVMYQPVQPIRPRCEFYKRQVCANDEVPDDKAFGHRIMFRNCMARHTVGGALLSVKDEAVYACDYREPPDPVSVDLYLDGPDRKRLHVVDPIERVPMFNLK